MKQFVIRLTNNTDRQDIKAGRPIRPSDPTAQPSYLRHAYRSRRQSGPPLGSPFISVGTSLDWAGDQRSNVEIINVNAALYVVKAGVTIMSISTRSTLQDGMVSYLCEDPSTWMQLCIPLPPSTGPKSSSPFTNENTLFTTRHGMRRAKICTNSGMTTHACGVMRIIVKRTAGSEIAAANPIQSMDIIQTVKGQHGTPEVRFHCLYMYYYQNVSKAKLSVLFGKAPSTISGWITQYEEGGGAARQARTNMNLRHGPERREWVVSQFHKKPVMHLSEAKSNYVLRYPGSTISAASISIILKEAGLSWKVLERRAIQICNADVIRFSTELMSFPWLLQSLLFLDEVSFDNWDMLASKGWGKKGESLVYVGEFVEYLSCTSLDLKELSKFFPGPHSLWIMDGAKIHTDKNIVYYLRSLGIKVIFLPAYCPFFNPIELLFGMVKQQMEKDHDGNEKDILLAVSKTFEKFHDCSLKNLFSKCGYTERGFNAATGFNVPLSSFNGFEDNQE
ncbi:hypothetical protein CcCBS67573_g07104 [Chytriomyces confervae]|uniref:Tc1-like transposase DDE domain-containing protein n=1 Tax=Chytriomyces confervae TaxID=246404 RepID=A0A507EXQ1_9FUNG|nr:hypothetical protein CcCBS67573_g07104 [Chytriomyces confervae]